MRLLRQGPFARLFAGSALNALGTWATLIALWGYAGVHFHVGPAGIALIGLTWAAPAAVLSPFAGVPVDRFGPKRVLVCSDAVGVVSSLAKPAPARSTCSWPWHCSPAPSRPSAGPRPWPSPPAWWSRTTC